MAWQFADFFNEVYLDNIQRNLKFITAILLILTLSLIIGIIVISQNSSKIAEELKEEKAHVCLTPGCIKKASNILNNMDPSVDPCEDFYKFSCGGFINKTYIPDDQPSVTSFTIIKNLVYQQIRNMLEEPSKPEEFKPFALTRMFYNSCVNTTAIEADGLTTIKEILESVGGWPVLEGTNWYDAKFDWKQSIYALRNIGYGANYFLSVRVIPDLKNTSQRVISIDEAKLDLPLKVLLGGLEHDVVKIYYDFMLDVAELFGANRSEATEELEESLNLQIAIANISLSSEERRFQNLLYNPMSIAKLQVLYPSTNWKQYIKYLLDIPDFQISDDEIVTVPVPQYLTELENLLEKSTKRTQANYMMWRVVSSSMYYLTKELRDRKLKFTKVLTGAKRPLPRWKECIGETSYRFWQPLRTLYDRKHFNNKSKNITTEMLSYIQTEFTKILQHTEWMDEATTKRALEKATSVKMYVSSFETQSDENLTEYYSTLNFNSNNFLRVALSIALLNNNRYFRNLRKPVEKEDESRDISMEYNIFVPGGIFQDVFFDNNQPHYVNYGGIGVLIGHLITHGFDNSGRQLDKDGDLANWWTVDTENAFKELAECFIEQYGNYTLPEVSPNLNAKNTRDENIADNGGMKTAYLAYNAWVEDNGPEPQLPGLNYTAQQMFWISTANVYCSKHRKEQLNLIVLTSRVAPEYYRVIGSLSNSEYFAKDFGCPLGSKMNPEVKCRIW